MAKITNEVLLEFAKYYVDYWNSGDRSAWIKNWENLATGEMVLHDPVGTPPKYGFEDIVSKGWDLFQPSLRIKIDPGLLFVCGNEISWVMENTFTKDGKTDVLRSIEVFRFNDDGSVEIKTYYDVPSHSDPISGDVFAEHLPEEC